MTWERVALGKLGIDVQTGFASGKHAGKGDVLHLRPMNITPHGALTLEVGKFVAATAGAQRVSRGDVLFNNTNSPKWVGKTAWITSNQELAFSNHMTRLRTQNDRINSQYLAIYLHHQQSLGYFEAICSNHVNQASVSRKRLLETEIPVPPLEEQRRIVAILEDHLSRLDAAQASLDSAAKRLTALTAQVLLERLARATYEELPLTGLLERGLSNGRSVPTREGGFPVLRLTALDDGKIDLLERKPGAWTAAEAERFLVRQGDFLISRGNGSLHLVGRGGLVTEEPDPVAFPDTLIRARPHTGLLDATFLALVWNAASVRRQIEKTAKTTAGIYKVNQLDLGRVVLPVPSVLEQQRIVSEVSEGRAALGRLKQSTHAARIRCDALRRSLLAAAFSGRLTGNPQPVSVLEGRMGA